MVALEVCFHLEKSLSHADQYISGVIWLFFAVMFGMFSVVLSLAEMASMYVFFSSNTVFEKGLTIT
jgi:hypothetical protein